ncbi:hypothetical protein H4219_005955 [Mycoemilia scoparia]|uniref:Uncharacterized protein n=1 Tax=Mycoemilia scoparia TaxID=417184 RepID=A0A9W7ZRD0_9FUNG|nr:hypothetical protein H4219_005955 [Mycoemilia scoparia]
MVRILTFIGLALSAVPAIFASATPGEVQMNADKADMVKNAAPADYNQVSSTGHKMSMQAAIEREVQLENMFQEAEAAGEFTDEDIQFIGEYLADQWEQEMITRGVAAPGIPFNLGPVHKGALTEIIRKVIETLKHALGFKHKRGIISKVLHPIKTVKGIFNPTHAAGQSPLSKIVKTLKRVLRMFINV